MKTKSTCLVFCMLLLSVLIAVNAKAQQLENDKPANTTIQLPATDTGANYTYRLFVAPNKLYGYDIFLHNNPIYHQPAMIQPAGNKQVALTLKSEADKAALLSIEKIKKGLPGELTRDELIQVTAH